MKQQEQYDALRAQFEAQSEELREWQHKATQADERARTAASKQKALREDLAESVQVAEVLMNDLEQEREASHATEQKYVQCTGRWREVLF